MKAHLKKGIVRPRALSGYAPFLNAVKNRIRSAQINAALSANAELIHLYWDIGRGISAMQQSEGWGAGVIPRLARDICGGMPDVKGFSERNIARMIVFYREYPDLDAILPTASAKLPARLKARPEAAVLAAVRNRAGAILPTASAKLPVSARRGPALPPELMRLPWSHHILLIQKVKDLRARLWYARQAVECGWSHDTLALQIDSRAHARQGRAVHNFQATLPAPQSDLAAQVLKDPYVFDFLTLTEPFRERELEEALLDQVQKFLLELGHGFAFVGRQFHLDVAEEDFFLDLLFYHLRLRCFVVVDLKRGAFKPEYAGKMNFYCNVVDDRLRHADDKATIGLVLCQDKNRIIAEYALKGVQKAIGVSEYSLTRALPRNLRASLPTVEHMESELAVLTSAGRKQSSS